MGQGNDWANKKEWKGKEAAKETLVFQVTMNDERQTYFIENIFRLWIFLWPFESITIKYNLFV